MRFLARVCVLFVVTTLASAARCATAQSLAEDRIKQLYEANDLDIDGHIPFRLHMTFELYDLSGKASEQGTVEMYGAPGEANIWLCVLLLLRRTGLLL